MALLLVVGGCGGGSDARPDTLERASILLVTIDTTRADRIGCYGYDKAQTPVLDGLAATGVRFADATVQSPTTLPSHASIMTGNYPPYHGARGNGTYFVGEENETLAETLAEAGYQTGAVVSAFVLDSRFGIGQGFEVYDDDQSSMAKAAIFTDASRPAPATNAAALAIADGFDRDQPYFLWVHYFDPHAPYSPLPEFRKRFPGDMSGRYDAEIATVDHYLGQLLESLRTRGLMRNTLVIATADHGEGFPGPHAEMTHGVFVYDDTIRVPLIFHAPHAIGSGLVREQLAREIDIVPTVLELVGVPEGEAVQGRSLASLLEDDAPPANESGGAPTASDADATADETVLSFSEAILSWDAQGWSPLYAVRDERWKLIQAPKPELYDLEADPGEQENLWSTDHPAVSRLMPELERMRDSANPMRPDGDRGQPMSSKEERRLRELGYIPGDANSPDVIPTDLAGLKDPKDYIDLQVDLEYGRVAFAEGNLDEGVRLFTRVIDRDPTNLEGNMQLATYHKDRGDFEKALAHTQVVIDARETWGSIHGLRAEIFQARGGRALGAKKKEEALADFRRAVESFERAAELQATEPAHLARAAVLLHVYLGDPGRAEEHFKRSLQIAPEEARTHFFYGAFLHANGRHPEAIEHLLVATAEAASLPPQRRQEGLFFLGGSYAYEKRLTDAIGAMDTLIREFPDDPQAQRWKYVRDELAKRAR